MNFSFWLGNHSKLGQRSLEDVIGIFGHGLRALGHQAVWDEANDKFLTAEAGYNVIVEGFNDEVTAFLAQYHAAGARFLCIATEEPTEKGFNHGTQAEMTRRQRDFPAAAKYIDGIFHLVPGDEVTRWYSQFAPSAPAELGYAPTLVRRETAPAPEYDFGFYGTMSKRRQTLLRRLAKKIGTQKAVRVVPNFAPQVERDAIMQSAKVIVQIRKFNEMGLVSSSRCNTALCLGRPVVAEPHALSHPWDEVIKFADTDEEFLDLAVVTRAAWRGVHAAQFDKFKAKFSPEVCVGRALHQVGLA